MTFGSRAAIAWMQEDGCLDVGAEAAQMRSTNCSTHALTTEGEPLTSGKIQVASNLTTGTEDISGAERVSTMAAGTPCRWVKEHAFGRREEHRERDLADEVEDPLGRT